MLDFFRNNHDKTKILITQEFRKDLAWFNTFLDQYNGVTFYEQPKPDFHVALDACLTGMGGHFGSMVYALEIPFGFKNYNIAHLEILNIIVASKIWADHWADKSVNILCDNEAVVEVLKTGKARDMCLATCARNIWLIAAIFNINFSFSHIPGKSNIVADLLSRWTKIPNNTTKLQNLVPNYLWIDTHLDLTILNANI